MTDKGITREFNRLYGNLAELFRRIYDDEKDYPRETCARWFVNELNVLMSDDKLKSRLNEQYINHILEMGVNLRRTKLIDNEFKKELTSYIKELKNIKKNILEVTNVK